MQQSESNIERTGKLVIDRYTYSFTARPFVFTNSLGFVRAILVEYQITAEEGQCIKLYKTPYRNWVDIGDFNTKAGSALIHRLKIEIDLLER